MTKKPNPKISIVLPVYNSNGYVKLALESLLAQSLCEIEIIAILDLPTDGSDIIVKEYAKKDSRIRIIENNENMHIGMNRNIGIDYANGEYVGFFDHDDCCDSFMYDELYTTAKKENADIVMSPGREIDSKGIFIDNHIFDEGITKKEIYKALICGERDTNMHYKYVFVHTNIYKKSFLNEFNLRFIDTRYALPEDIIFNIECSYHSNRIAIVNKNLYSHRIWNYNESCSKWYFDLDKWMGGYNHVIDFLEKYDNSSIPSYCTSIRDTLFWCIKQRFSNRKSLLSFIHELKNTCGKPYMPLVFRNKDTNNYTIIVHPVLRFCAMKFLRSYSLMLSKEIKCQ